MSDAAREYLGTRMEILRSRLIIERFQPWLQRSIVDVGCGTGTATVLLRMNSTGIGGIYFADPDPKCLAVTQEKMNCPGILASAENLREKTDQEFETVLLMHVLEHVDNPVYALGALSTVLTSKGKILVSVPNARSVHRRLGTKLGSIPYMEALGPSDIAVGHKRVYTEDSLLSDLREAGLRIAKCIGLGLKTLPNKSLEAAYMVQPKAVEASLAMEITTFLSADILVVAEKM